MIWRPARRGLAAGAGLVMALGAVACADTPDGGRITVYAAPPREVVHPILERFAEETGLVVDVRYGRAADLAERVRRDGSEASADVLLADTPGAVLDLAAEGRLAHLPATVLDGVDVRWQAPGGNWVGIAAHHRRVVANPRLLADADLPTTVASLVDPRYRDRLAVAPQDPSFRDFVAAMRVQEGDATTRAWLAGLRANGTRAYRDERAVVAAVAAGDVAMGLVDHDAVELERAEWTGALDPAIAEHGFAPGDLGNLVLVIPAAMLAGARHPEAAAGFLEYLLSPGTQTTFAAEAFVYPLGLDIEPPSGRAPLDEAGAISLLLPTGETATTARLIDGSGLASG